jgi:glycosyltransferase involved in cell wall biosynthesis
MNSMAPEQPLVSCVVIFYNAGRYLGEALASVAAQTYKNWELVLVDDGSTDDSRSVAEGFARRHPDRVLILEHPGRDNHGKSVSRNLGFSAARGEFIAMLDADDVWLPEKLAEQVNLMAANPDAEIVYGRVEFWYSWTGRPRDALKKYTSKLGVEPGITQDGRRLLETMLLKMARGMDEVTPYPSAMIFRKALLDRSGACDPDFKLLYDDVVFFIKAFLVARIHASDRVWTLYRVAPDDTYSPSYEAALTAGEWSANAPNAPEGMLLERAERYIRAAVPASRRLQLAVRLARLRYHSPKLYSLWRGLSVAKRLMRRPIAIAIQNWQFHVRKTPPRPGFVRWGHLQSQTPLRRQEAVSGQSIDRHAVRLFCERHANHITGDVLEFGDWAQTRRFGKNVTSVSVAPGNSVVDQDFVAPVGGAFDCVIAIDLIQYQGDLSACLKKFRQLLRPGGSLIVSFPALMPSLPNGDLWRFTPDGVRDLLSRNLIDDTVEIMPYGNTAITIAMLHGLGLGEVDDACRNGQDARNAVIILARVTRSS